MNTCDYPHRLKKVQGKKKRDAAAAEAKRLENLKAAGGEIEEGGADGAPAPNLLEEKDEDVIF